MLGLRLASVMVLISLFTSEFGLASPGALPGEIATRLKSSPVVLAAASSISFYAADFQKTAGRPLAREFLGLNARAGDNSIESVLYAVLGADKISLTAYNCHFPSEAVHCESNGQGATTTYKAPRLPFLPADFQVSFAEALSLHVQAGRAPQAITEVKTWQNRSTMEVVFTHGNPAAKAIYSCHYHGGSIDCHERKKAGPGEMQ